MGLKKTIANLLTQPSMIEEKKKIKKAKQGLIFRTGRSDTRNLIERTIRKALAANEELTSVLANYKIRLRSLDFIRADDEDEIDAYIPPQLNFINKTQSQVDEEQKKSHQRIQMAKDMIFMSDKNYEVFRNISQLEMPSLTSVKCIREELNKDQLIPINNQYGLYFNATEKIRLVVKKKLDTLKLAPRNILRVNIRGDATMVGRNQRFLNICFSLPDEGMIAKTAYGQYTLGIFELDTENYDTLSTCLEGIADHMKQMNNQIEVLDTVYQVEWSLGGDMAFIHHERGLNGCNSNNPCHLCRLEKKDFCINDPKIINSKLRSVEECRSFLKKKKGQREGYEHMPIFDFIDYDKVHCDTLHENIRIVNKLLVLLLRKLQSQENKLATNTNLQQLPLQKTLSDWLKSVGIKSPYTMQSANENSSELNMRSMTGAQCKDIAQKIDVHSLFPSLEHSAEIGQLFNNWWRIHVGYTHNFYIDKTTLLQERIDQWLTTFKKCFFTKECTVYMHHVMGHLSNKILKYGDMDLYNIQGLEKLNDITTTQYFRGTNRKQDYMSQLLYKRIRIEGYILDSMRKPETEKSIKKKLDRYTYYQNTDLFDEKNSPLPPVPIVKGLKSSASSSSAAAALFEDDLLCESAADLIKLDSESNDIACVDDFETDLFQKCLFEHEKSTSFDIDF